MTATGTFSRPPRNACQRPRQPAAFFGVTMSEISVRPHIRELDAYVPGLSIAEIQQKYGLSQVIKMASNENPLGASPLAQEAVRRHAPFLFRYPQGAIRVWSTPWPDWHGVGPVPGSRGQRLR